MTERDALIDKIGEWKERRNAVILVHNYQIGEVQDIGDFLGDSLELSRKARDTDAKVILFCGVRFMAETAYILSPNKTVLLPVLEAGCPMADMVDAESLKQLKSEHPGAVVVCYVNSSAEVKAESDICCTSANAANVVAQIPEGKEIIFVPDEFLGTWVQQKTGRKMILWSGFCPTHQRITADHIQRMRSAYPDARIMVHPECNPGVTGLADEVLSTGGMCRFAGETEAKTIIVGTEHGIVHRLKKENPGKEFIPITEDAVCPNMKLTTLEEVLSALKDMKHRIEVPEDVRVRAYASVQRMVEVLG
jgi:quinolinate synthase